MQTKHIWMNDVKNVFAWSQNKIKGFRPSSDLRVSLLVPILIIYVLVLINTLHDFV